MLADFPAGFGHSPIKIFGSALTARYMIGKYSHVEDDGVFNAIDSVVCLT